MYFYASRLILSILLISTLNSHALAELNTNPNTSDSETSSNLVRIPVEAELKRLMLATESSLEQQNFVAANDYLNKASELKAEMPSIYFYLKGMVQIHSNYWDKAKYNFEEYILRTTEDDKYYIQSLEMITYIENKTNVPSTTSSPNTSTKPEISWDQNITSSPHDDYISKIQSTYKNEQPKLALVNHINMILESTPLITSAQISNLPLKTITSISLDEMDKIKVQKRLISSADTKISSFSMSVFGLSREFISQCSASESKCLIKHKETMNTWFEISNDESAAHEIAEAISTLIFIMQKKQD